MGMTGRNGVDRKPVGSTAEQLRLRDSMLADLRMQNKALAGLQCCVRCMSAQALAHLYILCEAMPLAFCDVIQALHKHEWRQRCLFVHRWATVTYVSLVAHIMLRPGVAST